MAPHTPHKTSRFSLLGPKLRPKGSRRATIIILVLVSFASLAFVVTEIIAAATARLQWENQRTRHDALRTEAFSALETTLAVLGAFARIDGTLYGPAQGWSDPLEFANFSVGDDATSVTISLHDESGCYGLPALAADTFASRRFFQDLGISETQAYSLADCLADWTDAGDTARLNGAERDRYPEGVAPPNRPVQNLDELRLVQGFAETFFDDAGNGNELWEHFSAAISLVGSSARPNINTAPAAVLDILASRYAFTPEAIIAAREGSSNIGGTGTIYRNAADLGRAGFPVALADAVSFSCTRLRVIARASSGGVSVVVDTLLDTSAGGGNASTTQFPFAIIQQRVNALLQE
ncbi:MAG: general secretion pathway protein GspK [Puniceicoccales bacterium]|jgi:general secretion pathway protein K|nr:general secretion pathway protein GspK [Puniceicoccales bacterium]